MTVYPGGGAPSFFRSCKRTGFLLYYHYYGGLCFRVRGPGRESVYNLQDGTDRFRLA